MFPKLNQWGVMELIPSKSVNFLKDFIEVTIAKRRNKENVCGLFLKKE